MKIKSEKDFWIVAEDWYKRTHRLRLISENENETEERRSKAIKLFMSMLGRMQTISVMASRIKTSVSLPKFEKGTN